MIKAIITDLDGTLLHSDKTISDYTVKVLQKCRETGVKTVFATARSQQSSATFLRRFQPDVFIGHGGALTLTPNMPVGRGAAASQTVITSRTALSSETCRRLIRRCLETPAVAAVYAIHETAAFTSRRDTASDPGYSHYRYADLLSLSRESYLKVSMQCSSPETARRIAEEFPECRMQGYTGEDLFSFASAEATKWNAIQAFAAREGIGMEEIAAFGDDWNDLDMLQNCGAGVAVENAIPEVKAAARFHTASNDGDGVAVWLEAHLLTK